MAGRTNVTPWKCPIDSSCNLVVDKALTGPVRSAIHHLNDFGSVTISDHGRTHGSNHSPIMGYSSNLTPDGGGLALIVLTDILLVNHYPIQIPFGVNTFYLMAGLKLEFFQTASFHLVNQGTEQLLFTYTGVKPAASAGLPTYKAPLVQKEASGPLNPTVRSTFGKIQRGFLKVSLLTDEAAFNSSMNNAVTWPYYDGIDQFILNLCHTC